MKRKLHIGGKQRADGWEILNAVPAEYVDHACNAKKLPQFSDGTFSEIYASHVVEHLDYKGELTSTLKEWWRVTEPGGKLYISAPDLDVLTQLFVSREQYTINDRFNIMKMIFGGHVNKYDYHFVGLNEEFLSLFLGRVGYENIRKVDSFDLFDDSSNMKFKDAAISVNLIAEKPV